MKIHHLEIVTPQLDATCASLAAQHGVAFSAPTPELGGARLAEMDGGGWIGVREPLRDTEASVVRPYRLVDDIDAALEAAQAEGADIAMGRTPTGEWGAFAIYMLGGIEHGLWDI